MDTLKQEWQEMLERGIMPVMEFQTSPDDWLLVEIELHEHGLQFTFDSDNKRVAFDEEISVINDNCYRLVFDMDSTLDQHIQYIHENIVEGYLLVNNLYYCEED